MLIRYVIGVGFRESVENEIILPDVPYSAFLAMLVMREVFLACPCSS